MGYRDAARCGSDVSGGLVVAFHMIIINLSSDALGYFFVYNPFYN